LKRWQFMEGLKKLGGPAWFNLGDRDLATHIERTFQDYFVRRQCEPVVSKLEYAGAMDAHPSHTFGQALAHSELKALVICPSNPLLSIEPILSLAGVRRRIECLVAPVVAVSPIVGGQAIKGPAAKILRELGREVSALEVARYYTGLIDGLVIDDVDADLAPAIEALGMDVLVTATVMKTRADREKLASLTLQFASRLLNR
jgi:LPPG:FO 2-phospho-L-lactate transferase